MGIRAHHILWIAVLLILMGNAYYPWFILVPETSATEFYQLEHAQQQQLLEQINLISGYLKEHHAVDKLNIGCIGNIVPQMHIHIIGRKTDDPCWPHTVWGSEQRKDYRPDEVAAIKQHLQSVLGNAFQAT